MDCFASVGLDCCFFKGCGLWSFSVFRARLLEGWFFSGVKVVVLRDWFFFTVAVSSTSFIVVDLGILGLAFSFTRFFSLQRSAARRFHHLRFSASG